MGLDGFNPAVRPGKKTGDWHFDMLGSLAIAGGICAQCAFIYYLFYQAGLGNQQVNLNTLMRLLVFDLVLLAVFLFIVVRFARHGRKFHGRYLWQRIVLVIFPLLVGAACWGFSPTGADAFRTGFKKWVQVNVDIKAIRAWLETSGRDYVDRECVPPTNQPESIKKLCPNDVTVRKAYDQEDGPCSASMELQGPDIKTISACSTHIAGADTEDNLEVWLTWGGGFSHWGIVIGPKTMEPLFPEYEKEYGQVQIAPGVYLWDE